MATRSSGAGRDQPARGAHHHAWKQVKFDETGEQRRRPVLLQYVKGKFVTIFPCRRQLPSLSGHESSNAGKNGQTRHEAETILQSLLMAADWAMYALIAVGLLSSLV